MKKKYIICESGMNPHTGSLQIEPIDYFEHIGVTKFNSLKEAESALYKIKDKGHYIILPIYDNF